MSNISAHVRTYSPGCRVANWFEDIALEEDKLKDFLDRKSRGDLLIQKSQRFIETILCKVQLSVSPDAKVRFGDKVMIMNKGDPKPQFEGDGPAVRDSSVLSATVTQNSEILTQCQLMSPCEVSGCRKLEPVVKTVFIVTSCDGSKEGDVLKYGQPFYLKTLSGCGGDLYLQSDIRSFMESSKKARNQRVVLVDLPSHLTEWACFHANPQVRMEFEFTPIPTNEKLVISHVKTGHNLSVEAEHTVKTPLGREYEISCCTKLDSHKAEKSENLWYFVEHTPGSATLGMNDVPLPEPEKSSPP